MPRQAQFALLILLSVLAGLTTWQVLQVREPVSQGQPLTVWLRQYGTNHWTAGRGGDLDRQAQAAIRQVGTNAIPFYL